MTCLIKSVNIINIAIIFFISNIIINIIIH